LNNNETLARIEVILALSEKTPDFFPSSAIPTMNEV
jgi:hypothetical protein